MLRNKGGRHATEFILSYENHMNYALEGGKPPGYTGAPWGGEARKSLVGWHKERDRHVAGFFDGSARYRRYDTRFVFGEGWTIWPTKPWTDVWEAHNDLPPTDEHAN